MEVLRTTTANSQDVQFPSLYLKPEPLRIQFTRSACVFCLPSICLEFTVGVLNCNDTNAVLRWNIKRLNTGVLISPEPDQEGNRLRRQKILIFIYPLYNHNWRNINTIYIYKKTSIKRNILRGANKSLA